MPGFWHRNFTKSESAQTGVADFNGDGYENIVWHTPSSGQNEVWYGASNGYFTAQTIASMPGGYAHKSFAGDFDGDGYGDIFWKPVGGDFNGDGIGDLFWFSR